MKRLILSFVVAAASLTTTSASAQAIPAWRIDAVGDKEYAITVRTDAFSDDEILSDAICTIQLLSKDGKIVGDQTVQIRPLPVPANRSQLQREQIGIENAVRARGVSMRYTIKRRAIEVGIVVEGQSEATGEVPPED